MLLRTGIALAVALATSGCGCSNSTPPASDDGAADAPLDTARDTAADVQSDVAADVLTDTARDVQDAAEDAGPDDPGWVPLPDLPDGCVVERALYPERLLRNEWADCGPGCQYLVRDDRFDRGVNASGFHDGERGYFVTNQGLWSEPERERKRIIVLAATDGAVLGAWRGLSPFAETQCRPTTVTVGDGHSVLDVVITTSAVRQHRLYFARLDGIGTLEVATAVLGADVVPVGTVLQRSSMSRHVFASELQPGGHLLLVRPDGSVDRQSVAGNPQVPHVVGEDVFVEAWSGPSGHIVLHRARFGEGNAPFIADPDAHIAGTFPTAENLSWFVAPATGAISSAERIDLWTSPFTNDASTLEPRFVTNIVPDIQPGYSRGFQGSGLYVTDAGPVIRLTDGALLDYPPGAGRSEDVDVAGNFGYLWVAGGELALRAVLLGGRANHGTVRRDLIGGLVPAE